MITVKQNKRFFIQNILIAVGFGLLSIAMSYIRFVIPTFNFMTSSSLNEVAILVSILFLPHWGFVVITGAMTAATATNELQIFSAISHAASAALAWIAYHRFFSRYTRSRQEPVIWVIVVVLYYYIFLLPQIVGLYFLFDPNPMPITQITSVFVVNMSSELIVTLLITLLFSIMRQELISRRETERALAEKEERYRVIAEQTGQLIYDLDVKTGAITWTGAIELNTGFTSEEFLRVDLKTWETMIHPEDRPKAISLLDEAMASGNRYRVEYRFRKKDGGYVFMDDNGLFLRDGKNTVYRMLGTMTNIDDRKKAEQSIKENVERFEIIARATNDAVWDWDARQDKVWWNEAARRLFAVEEYHPHDNYQLWQERLHPEDRERVTQKYKNILESTQNFWSDEFRFRLPDGSYGYFYDRAYILRDVQGRPTRVLGSMTDLTERKKLEQNLIQAQKTESLGRVAGGIAHDINNMLAVILPTAELLLNQNYDTQAVHQHADVIVSSARRASDIVKQLLVFARQTPSSAALLNINNLVGETRNMLDRFLGKNITITLHLEPEIAFIDADATQVQQIIINLCVNARDAMNNKGSIGIETKMVELNDPDSETLNVPTGLYVQLSIADSGTGIPPEVMDKIFEPFFSTKDIGKGTGLGLAVVKTIITNHGGYIRVQSHPGSGTRMELGFPVSQRVTLPHVQAQKPQYEIGTGIILLVDDEKPILEMGEMVLKRLGYQCYTAENGYRAVEVLNQKPVDLVILDVQMPGMDGIETLEKLLEIKANLKFLFTSGYIGADRLQLLHSKYPDHIVSKPYTVEELSKAIKKLLDTKSA